MLVMYDHLSVLEEETGQNFLCLHGRLQFPLWPAGGAVSTVGELPVFG